MPSQANIEFLSLHAVLKDSNLSVILNNGQRQTLKLKIYEKNHPMNDNSVTAMPLKCIY